MKLQYHRKLKLNTALAFRAIFCGQDLRFMELQQITSKDPVFMTSLKLMSIMVMTVANLRSVKDRGSDQVGKWQKRCSVFFFFWGDKWRLEKQSACQCSENLLNQSCLLGKLSVVQSGFYHKPTGFGKVGDKCNTLYFEPAKASTFVFLDWW